MKTALTAQLGQQLALTPQLLQSIRLLQLDAMQLELEVRRALETNPLLEREDEAEALAEEAPEAMGEHQADEGALQVDIEDADIDFEAATWGVAPGSGADDDICARQAAPEYADLRQRLLAQYALERSDSRELAVADFLIDHLDASGYLPLDPEALAEAATAHGVDLALLETVRLRLMRLDPAGIGARDLRECLLVQIDELAAATPHRALARQLVDTRLDALMDPSQQRLAELLGCGVDDAAGARALVLTLQPRPASVVTSVAAEVVVPDVIIRRVDGHWKVSLNPLTSPKIRINPTYERMLGDGAEAGGLREMLGEARWLTRGLAMRYDTLLRATQAIVERQHAFLEHGEEAMLPLNLKEIAAAIGMHESTISRIATAKYVQTPRGTFEIKRFFPVKLEGATVAGSAVKAMVRKLIDGENPEAPLADDQVVTLLAHQGVRIARRTVAKYRDQLRIAPARERQRRSSAAPLLARAS